MSAMSSYESLAQRCREKHGFTNVFTGFNEVVLHPAERIFLDEEEKAIEEAWQKSGAGKRNEALVALFPSETRVQESILHLSGYPTDYKHWFCTKDMLAPEVWLTGPSAVTRLVGGDEPIYVFGERKSKNLNTGGVLEFLPGGLLKAKHLHTTDPFRFTLEDELDEETGIAQTHIAHVGPLWYGELAKFPDGRTCRNVCLDYLMDVRGITPEQVEKEFRSKEREHTHLEYVQESVLPNYFEANFARFNTRSYCTIQQLVGQGVLR